MFTKKFWKAVTERALKSAAQGALAVWSLVQIAGLEDAVNAFQAAGWAALSMSVLSVLTSIGSGAITNGEPSLSNAEVLPNGAHESAPENKAA